ncbi:hypothetical protein [Blastomonas sp. UPD001]|uniref:hypothetical protein n=1 Tax=Blastomonas sp. UPD001 TaxID=2217673 RepID=UPI000E3553E8|nr:hypothetical protein [Blastomonas sp. UPD001]
MSDLAASLYAPVLSLHGGWRWVVLGALLAAIIATFRGRGSGPASRLAVVAVDVQLTIGLLLYLWLSPVTRSAMRDGFSDSDARFFGLVHFAAMLCVVVFAHAAGMSVRRGASRRGAWLFTIALGLSLAATPWWRPLLRF